MNQSVQKILRGRPEKQLDDFRRTPSTPSKHPAVYPASPSEMAADAPKAPVVAEAHEVDTFRKQEPVQISKMSIDVLRTMAHVGRVR